MKVIKVRTKVKEDGKVLAIIFCEGRDEPIFLTDKQIQSACGLSKNFSALKGSDLSVEFYKKGDKLVSGAEVTDDDKIVKEFEIEVTETMSKMSQAAAYGMGINV